ncbi:MAG: Hsp20/alpha crystallin family protein [Deltaproteobacteria bacterium]|nr:Hsp20/alpha crystallin family protein [Deltaproteobacteria bacterium]
MNFIKWMPRSLSMASTRQELERLAGHVEKMYETVLKEVDTWRRSSAGVYPPVNLYEDDNALYLTAELAGVSASDLELTAQGDSLTLRGERKIPETESSINYHRREREGGFFRRVIALPVKIDHDQIKAVVKDGVLVVTMPKAGEAKARQITVASA